MSTTETDAIGADKAQCCIKLAAYLKRNCNLINSSQRHIKTNLLFTNRVLVDGLVEKNPSRRIRPGKNTVKVLEPAIFVYNKPCGIVTALSDANSSCVGSTKPISDYVNQYPGLHIVGRLDEHSCGLLLLTNDGHVTKMLKDPKQKITRRYKCVVMGIVTDEKKLRLQIEDGIETRHGTYHGKLISAREEVGDIEFEHRSCIKTGNICIRNDGPCHAENDDAQHIQFISNLNGDQSFGLSEVSIEITEGKMREVRRILAHCGHPVLNLRREAYGVFELGSVKAGDIRAATRAEMKWIISERKY